MENLKLLIWWFPEESGLPAHALGFFLVVYSYNATWRGRLLQRAGSRPGKVDPARTVLDGGLLPTAGIDNVF